MAGPQPGPQLRRNDIDLGARREMRGRRASTCARGRALELFRRPFFCRYRRQRKARITICCAHARRARQNRCSGHFIMAGGSLRHHSAIDRGSSKCLPMAGIRGDERRTRHVLVNLSGIAWVTTIPALRESINSTHRRMRTKICFESPRTAALAIFSQANRFIHALKELGCKFALDDFGYRLSSFGYLKHFPVDF